MSVSARQARERLSQRLHRRSREDIEADAAARALLPVLTKTLNDAGATRVVLFGSLATELFRAHSDIDLAVGGLTERRLAGLERELTLRAGRPVELANLEAMSSCLRDQIGRFGQELP